MSSFMCVSYMSRHQSGSSISAMRKRSVPTIQLWVTSKPNHICALIQ